MARPTRQRFAGGCDVDEDLICAQFATRDFGTIAVEDVVRPDLREVGVMPFVLGERATDVIDATKALIDVFRKKKSWGTGGSLAVLVTLRSVGRNDRPHHRKGH